MSVVAAAILQPKIDRLLPMLAGTCDSGMGASTTTIVCADLAGYGDDFFNDQWDMQVVKNANSIGAAPSGEIRNITNYVSASGTFTTVAFTVNVEENDKVVLLHRSILQPKIDRLLPMLAGTCDSGMGASTTTIVCADLAGYGNDYFNDEWDIQIVKNANSIGAAPSGEIRNITDYVSASGTFTTVAFTVNVEENDKVILLHRSISKKNFQEYTSGSDNWTVPNDVTMVDVMIVGGGGGGGGKLTGGYAGGGGGGGEIVMLHDYAVTPKSSIAYVIGAGGNGGTTGASPTDGTTGGSSSFGGITAYGGELGTNGDANSANCFGGRGGHFQSGKSADPEGEADIYTGGAGAQRYALGDGAIVRSGQKGKTLGGYCITRIGGGGGGVENASGYGCGGDSLAIGGSSGGGSHGSGGNAATNGSNYGGGGGYGYDVNNGGNGAGGYVLITWGV